MLRTVPLSINRRFSLYTQQWYMSYRFCWQLASKLSAKPLLCVQWKTPDDGQRICPKHHHHHHMSVMELGHLLTRSGLAYLEVSSEVCHDSFCQLGNSVSLSWVVCHEAFCLYVVSSSSCIPVVCLETVLFIIPLQCVNLFCNLSKCILLFFSYISFLLLFFPWHPLI